MDPKIARVIRVLKKETAKYKLPVVSAIARSDHDPFLILVSCILSLRTRDKVAVIASDRLFKRAATPRAIARMRLSDLETYIHSVNFYRNKAKAIRGSAERIIREFGGKVPDTLEGLLSLPGVGRKTANLVLGLGFRKAAICVDTHVHRMSNLLGWVKTKTPEETEQALEKALDKKYWIIINELMVTYGQNLCFPVRPQCGKCCIRSSCAFGKKTKTK